jgi:regulator of replication initiation timing
MIIQSKPELKEKIFTTLLDFEKTSPYSESQKALMKFHLLEIIQQNRVLKLPETIYTQYILDSMKSVSPKTRKKAKELVEKYNL